MSLKLSEMSCVQWFEGIETHKCGYCKQKDTSISNGMWAHSLTVNDYQNLIDRGWRRSGMYCYKPVMEQTCCPQYTIKCDVINFSLSKSQKKVIKKFNKFLETDILIKKDIPTDEDDDDGSKIFVRNNPNTDIKKFNMSSIHLENKGDGASSRESQLPITEEVQSNLQNMSGVLKGQRIDRDKSYSKTFCNEGAGADGNKPPCKKAKLIRIERRKEKLSKKGLTIEKKIKSDQKSLEQFLEEMPSNAKNRFKTCLIPTSVPNDEWVIHEKVEFELYKRYQTIIHNDQPEELKMSGFQGFLVKSPIKPEKFPDGIEGPGYGSFHQQYWLNDKLIAVGVLDILPRCISSVYFFYDPDYRSLTLGSYGSLREVQLSRSLHRHLPDLASYYMGFYIHSCAKMRYKGKLSPSFLLCPETYEWVPIERCLTLLDRAKYARLNGVIDASAGDVPSREEILSMKIIHDGQFMFFEDYEKRCEVPTDFVQIGNLVGRRCCGSLVFWET